jgi:hypothetical protein
MMDTTEPTTENALKEALGALEAATEQENAQQAADAMSMAHRGALRQAMDALEAATDAVAILAAPLWAAALEAGPLDTDSGIYRHGDFWFVTECGAVELWVARSARPSHWGRWVREDGGLSPHVARYVCDLDQGPR